MPTSDRAFRALARAEPESIIALLEALTPDLVPRGALVTREDLDDTRLDALPPPRDADWIARVGAELLLHLECQGYRDRRFPERLLRYHISLMLRYPDRLIETIALWLIEPPPDQAPDIVVVGHVQVQVTALVLPRLPAENLLQDPLTACFAAGADLGDWTVEELCLRVAVELRRGRATYYQRHMAVVAAAMRGRYDALQRAMEQQAIEPVIIEDLVFFGEDRGILKQAREDLRVVLSERGLLVSPEQHDRIGREESTDRLRLWLRRAITAPSASAVFID